VFGHEFAGSLSRAGGQTVRLRHGETRHCIRDGFRDGTALGR
jgi:hypothetical protein